MVTAAMLAAFVCATDSIDTAAMRKPAHCRTGRGRDGWVA